MKVFYFSFDEAAESGRHNGILFYADIDFSYTLCYYIKAMQV